MTYTLRGTLIIGILIYFIIILCLLKTKSLKLGYTLLWIFFGLMMFVFAMWPGILGGICAIFGITSMMNGLFLSLIAFILLILISITGIVSRQYDRIKNLTQTIGRMEKRIRELEEERVE